MNLHLCIASLIIIFLGACSGEQNSSGLTIADRIEIAAGETAALSLASTEWADATWTSNYVADGITVSDSMEMTISWDIHNRFVFTAVAFANVPEAITISGSGTATYDYITDTMTIAGIGILTDASTDTSSFTMSIVLTGVALNTISEATKFDMTDYEPFNMTINYNSGERILVYSMSAGSII